MARLDHPNVIRVYDVGTAEALPYMVMELAEGGSVNQWIELHGRMPPALACDVTMQVAAGLGAAHRMGVVHRDVKPHNVLVTAAGVCKVTDFGIARVQLDANLTRTGSTMGTIGYMAPEQRADAKLVDARADIYALGAVLFKLATGVIVTDLFLVEHEPRLLEHVAEPLREVIVRACYHDRERRFADTDELVATLREVRALLPQIPEDTPRLPIPPEDPSIDRSGLMFPEIAEILRARRTTATPAPQQRSADSQPSPRDTGSHRISYTMSRPEPRGAPRFEGASEPPSYLVTDGVDATVSQPTPPIRPFRSIEPAIDSEPSLAEPVAPQEAEATHSWVKVLAVAAIAAWVVLGLSAGWGAWSVRDASQRALVARANLYATVEQEEALIPELAEKGAPAERIQPVSELYDRFALARGEPERSRAAVAYVRAAREEAVRTLASVPTTDLTVGRATNLDRAFTSWANAQHDWESAAWWPTGRLAVNLGLAPRP
jgi:serine/threonine protein kinase